MQLDPVTALKREILLTFDKETVLEMNEELCLQFLIDKVLKGNEPIYINNLWSEIEDSEFNDWLRDQSEEFRSSGKPTGLPDRKGHRYYDSEEVAQKLTNANQSKMPTGVGFPKPSVWIAWTYWHGGGKYDAPENMPWIEDAYFVNMTTEMREVQVFSLCERE